MVKKKQIVMFIFLNKTVLKKDEEENKEEYKGKKSKNGHSSFFY